MTATPRANVGGLFVNSMPIEYLSLLVFPLFFWVFSFVFMAFEKVGILQQYRLRTPAEAEKLNKVTPWECAVNVLGNQILEFLAGILSLRLLGPGPLQGMWAASPRWVALGVLYSLELVGLDVNQLMAKMSAEPHHLEHQLVEFASSFVVPAMQFLVALFVADTWQYFAHRLFHTNKFLYSKVTPDVDSYAMTRRSSDLYRNRPLVAPPALRSIHVRCPVHSPHGGSVFRFYREHPLAVC